MKTVILLFCLLTTFSYSQTAYQCSDVNNKEFNLVITDHSYSIVMDSFMITTKLDTVITTDYYSKYIPVSNVKDTLTIYQYSLISFSTKYKPTTFVILRQNTPEELTGILQRKLIIINSN